MNIDSRKQLRNLPMPRRRATSAWLLGVVCLVGVLTTDGVAQEIETGYGKISGSGYRNSVNGTLVFSELFKANGHKVRTWRSLSPRISKYNTLVWFPDEFTPPNAEARTKIEDWLFEDSGRTLIYVGRDYDAASEYWDAMLSKAQDKNASLADIEKIARKRSQAHAEYDARRHRVDSTGDHGWFSVEASDQIKKVKNLEGPWAYVCDASKTSIEIRDRYVINETIESQSDSYYYVLDEDILVEELLSSDGQPIIFRLVYDFGYGTSQIIVVTNGSFLLNVPMVNHEHRKLADRLVQEAAPESDVLFIESGPDPIKVIEIDQRDRQQTAWDWMSLWPWSFVVPHLFVVALVFCFAYFPIFGRAKELRDTEEADFGRHIAALGGLYAKTDDGKYMLDKIKYYQEHVRRDSGQSHSDTKPSKRIPDE